jgi:hypothetical protein
VVIVKEGLIKINWIDGDDFLSVSEFLESFRSKQAGKMLGKSIYTKKYYKDELVYFDFYLSVRRKTSYSFCQKILEYCKHEYKDVIDFYTSPVYTEDHDGIGIFGCVDANTEEKLFEIEDTLNPWYVEAYLVNLTPLKDIPVIVDYVELSGAIAEFVYSEKLEAKSLQHILKLFYR